MELLKTGRSVIRFITGDNVEQDDYVATLDCSPKIGIDTAFSMFVTKLKVENDVKVKNHSLNDFSISDEKGNTYTMAHERVTNIKPENERLQNIRNGDDQLPDERELVEVPDAIEVASIGKKKAAKRVQDKWEVKPSNILRHMCTRNFRFQNLYLDGNNNLVDITEHAVRDINNRVLIPQINLKTAARYNENVIIDTIFMKIARGYMISNIHSKDLFEQDYYYANRIDCEDVRIKELCERKTSGFFRFLCANPKLEEYFIIRCGLKFKVEYVQAKKSSIPQDIYSYVEQYVEQTPIPVEMPPQQADPINDDWFNHFANRVQQ